MRRAGRGILLFLAVLALHAPLSVGAGNADGTGLQDGTVERTEEAAEPGAVPGDALLGEDAAGTLAIVCISCASIAAAAGIAAWAIHGKRGRNASRKAGQGIPIQIEVYAGRCRNKTASLELHDRLTIGSAADCDIIFDDPEVAPLHSCISLEGSQLYIEDLGSSRGTALDGMRIQGKNRLRGGETISVGPAEFGLRYAYPDRGNV